MKCVKFTGQLSIIAYFWRFTDGLQCDSANNLLITRDVEYYHGIFQCRSTCGKNQSSSLLINRTVLCEIITLGVYFLECQKNFPRNFLVFDRFLEKNLERKGSWARGGGIHETSKMYRSKKYTAVNHAQFVANFVFSTRCSDYRSIYRKYYSKSQQKFYEIPFWISTLGGYLGGGAGCYFDNCL